LRQLRGAVLMSDSAHSSLLHESVVSI